MCDVSANLAKFYSKLNEFRQTERYVDVSIKCGKRIFKCHRLALTIASNYFDAMFAGNFTESRTASNIVLRETDAETFEQILNFVYTGKVIINAANVYNLFRASDFFGLSYIEEECVNYVKSRSELTVKNLLDIFAFACATNRNQLKQILSVYMAENFEIIYRTDLFLQTTFEDLIIILNHYSSMSTRNEDTLLSSIIRWIQHDRVKRSLYLNKFWKIVSLEKISLQLSKLMVEEVIASNPVRAQTQKIISSIDDAEMTKLSAIIKPTIFLHVYVRYSNEKMDRIFSRNANNDKWIVSSEISATSNQSFNFHRVSTLDNAHRLYSVSYSYGGHNQTFSSLTSVDGRSTLALTPPPVTLQSSPDMCHVPSDHIYLYNKVWNGIRLVKHSNHFTDEEIGRRIYAYNCNLDKWFSVPPAIQVPNQDAGSLVACDNVVYLIGGDNYSTFEQAYDVRTAKWQKLPKFNSAYMNPTCVTLEGKIYVFGDTNNYIGSNYSGNKPAQRYDPKAGKWEKICASSLTHERISSYSGKIWTLCSRNSHFMIDIYDPLLNQWCEPKEVDLMRNISKIKSNLNFNITDCVVFK